MSFSLPPIPEYAGETANWQHVPINESGEPLVSIGTSHSFPDILTFSVYSKSHEYLNSVVSRNTRPVIHLRRSAAERLQKAHNALPPNIQLLVVDGYRSQNAQQSLYQHYADELKRHKPHLDRETIGRYTQKFVSEPSRKASQPSPHATGGALDVVLIRDGQMLEFGTAFDHGSPRAALRYFENPLNILHERDKESRANRRLLYWAMIGAGFAGYSYEWWHFNAPETQMGASCLGSTAASFGYVEPGSSDDIEPVPVVITDLPIERIAPRPEDMVE